MEALRGIRIVDFTWAAAGPYITQLLAYLGAEVIRIESTRRLDLLRVLPQVLGWTEAIDVNQSPPFHQINANKLSVTLNLHHPKGVALVKRLVAISQAVVENFSPGVMDRLGLGYEALRAVKPDLVMLSSSISGRHGPEAALKGYAPIMAALGGVSHLTGYADDEPSEIRGPADLIAATQAAYALMVALYHQRKTGQGQYIDFASREAQCVLIPEALLEYAMHGRILSRQGNAAPGLAPHNCYPCRGEDRWISIAVSSEEQWQALCRLMGNPAWCRAPQFADAYQRWCHREALDQHLAAWTRQQEAEELAARLQAAGIAAAPSMDARQLVSDPHLQARGAFCQLPHPELGTVTVLGPPFKMSCTPPAVVRAAPALGEHNDYVFGELLGLSAAERRALAAEGVFA